MVSVIVEIEKCLYMYSVIFSPVQMYFSSLWWHQVIAFLSNEYYIQVMYEATNNGSNFDTRMLHNQNSQTCRRCVWWEKPMTTDFKRLKKDWLIRVKKTIKLSKETMLWMQTIIKEF